MSGGGRKMIGRDGKRVVGVVGYALVVSVIAVWLIACLLACSLGCLAAKCFNVIDFNTK